LKVLTLNFETIKANFPHGLVAFFFAYTNRAKFLDSQAWRWLITASVEVKTMGHASFARSWSVETKNL
jgi:hypothetical protein